MRAPSEDFRVQAAPKDETALFAGARRFIPPPRYGIADQRTIFDADARSGYCRTSRPLDPASSRTKRSFDIVASILALALFLPGLLAIAAAIRLTSRGSVLFVQRRYGLNNKIFMIYKFRTMYVDKGDETGVEQTREADQRVTPIGKLLRRHNLDELPQLLNIVKGDMSLVGPRPHVPGNLAGGLPYEVLVTNYFERHRVRPGLSGLAQANGFRGSTTDANLAKARIDLDLHYIQNWSFGLDLRIILRTIRSQFLKSGKGI
jgi:lipopolysaccharide/colanic/teichoic acid biosynthesis glycosyltransferase